MISLLFISNSPKLEAIKIALQPMLKSKINIVTDFDHGLRDVFEKRPTTIIIQEQISGVTGESVARHIQMLLGASAPKFILIHEGNPRIKPVKALFEHLIDLTQPHEKLLDDIQAALKAVLGAEWEKIIILPVPDRAAIAATFAMPEENRLHADRLVDDFLSDLESADSTTISPEEPQMFQVKECQEEPCVVEDTLEFMNRLQAEVDQIEEPETLGDYQPGQDVQVEPVIVKRKKTRAPKPRMQASPDEETDKPELSDPVKLAPLEITVTAAETSAANLDSFETPTQKEKQVEEPVSEIKAVPAGPDFIIKPDTLADEDIPEDILSAFAENYHSQRRLWKKSATACVFFAVLLFGGWWYFKQNQQQLVSKNGPVDTVPNFVSEKKAAPVVTAKLSTEVQKPVSSSRSTGASLPSFVMASQRDFAYSKQKPGWERYLGKQLEYRIFRSGEKIKALQIMAAGTEPVSEIFLKEALKEFAGTSDYKILSKEKKQGYLIQRGNVGAKVDLMIYRTQKGLIRAFVVSPG